MRVSRITALLITAMMIPAISGCTTQGSPAPDAVHQIEDDSSAVYDDDPIAVEPQLDEDELDGEPLEGVNKIAKTIENKGFSRKGKADGKNFVRWKPLHILERCKEKRQGKAAVRHGLGIVFKL